MTVGQVERTSQTGSLPSFLGLCLPCPTPPHPSFPDLVYRAPTAFLYTFTTVAICAPTRLDTRAGTLTVSPARPTGPKAQPTVNGQQVFC